MIYMTSKLRQTSARHLQVWSRHPQTPSRHLPDIGVFMHKRALEEQAISELAKVLYIFTNIFGISTSPDTQTLSRHPQTQSRHPQAMAFLCNTGQRNKRQYLSVLTWYNLFANRFGTNTSPDILRLLPDIIQTPKDTGSPRQRRFYVIQGTCHIYCALSYIKMPMSEGVWMVSGVSRGCLDGVWMVSGWCFNGVWMVFRAVWDV